MSQTASEIFSFGSGRIGLSDLRVQPRTIAGATTGSPISSGFTEIGRGVYLWSATVPDDAVFLHAYSSGTPAILCVGKMTNAASAETVTQSADETVIQS
jgi:hypothetical protein